MANYLLQPSICGDDWGITNVNENAERYIHRWTIKQFSSHERCDINMHFESPYFTALNRNWSLILYPSGKDTIDKQYLSVYLVFTSSDDGNLREIDLTKVDFYIRNSNLRVVSSRTLTNAKLKVGQPLGVTVPKTEIWSNSAARILLDDSIMIECHLSRKLTVNVESLSGQFLPAVEKQVFTFLISDKFRHLIKNISRFDIVLICRSREFMVHKAVLAGRCPLFFSSLKRRLEKRRGREVYLSFIAPEVLKELLHFIYTEEAPKIEIMPRELLAMAENYGLEDLKYKCELVLSRKLTVDNIHDMLCFAEINNARVLKSEALEFGKMYAKEIAEANRRSSIIKNTYR